MEQLPVAVTLDGVLGSEVRAWAEERGWQVVDVDGPPPPAVVLTDDVHGDRPCVVVVDGPASVGQVRGALQAGAIDVIAWPDDRERLSEVPARVQRIGPPREGPRALCVAGAGGGVGTSTVALAVGGLLAWSGRRVVVVGGDDLLVLCGGDPWRGPGAAEIALLDEEGAALEVGALALPVPGVADLWVLGGGAAHVHGTDGWPFDAVVLDLRCDGRARADLLCARPDVHLAAAAGARGALVLLGDGPLDGAAVKAAWQGPVAGRLPQSARVGRAGAAGQVPSSLPGTWLRDLRAALLRVPA